MYTIRMKQITWSEEKNRELKENPNRAVCFEDMVAAIEGGGLLDDIEHVSQDKYAHQRMYIVLFNDYVYCVPYVTKGNAVFLKTVFPSRKFTHIYLTDKDHG
jgi:hypothetical protein